MYPFDLEHDVPPRYQPNARTLKLIRTELLECNRANIFIVTVCITVDTCLLCMLAIKGVQADIVSIDKNPKPNDHKGDMEHIDKVLER